MGRRRNRRFEHIELEMCMAAIETLPVALQHVLLRELASELASAADHSVSGSSVDQRIRRAVRCLHDVADLIGHSPSQYEYRQAHAALPELGLMSDSAIRRAFGNASWNECLTRALLDVVSEGDFAAPSLGAAFTIDELAVAVRAYVDEHDGYLPTLSELLAWCHDPRVQARPGRWPLSPSAFVRFGYPAVLRRAGFDGRRFSKRGSLIALNSSYTKEERIAAVRRLADELGRTPREADYRDWYTHAVNEVAAGRKVEVPPSVTTVKAPWGNWSNVIEAVGLPPLEPARSARPWVKRRPRYTREQKLDALVSALEEVGEPLTCAAYMAWRRSKLDAAERADEDLHIPDTHTIAGEFGGWAAALRAARAALEERRGT